MADSARPLARIQQDGSQSEDKGRHTVVIPYSRGLSEDVRRICRRYDIRSRVAFRSGRSLRSTYPQTCSAMADLLVSPFLQASLCSLILVSSLRMVSPIYTFPHEHGTWYTTPELNSVGNLSLTLVTAPD